MRLLPTLFAVFAVLALAAALPAWSQGDAALATDDLWIETDGGSRYHFTVELALTRQDQARGLMHRESMAPDAGMLFVFDPPRPASFWMRNTLISLDMLFIDAEGRIVNIAERTTPQTDDPHSSAGPVRAVLEINGGLSAMLGIAPGDLVVHETFGTAPTGSQ